VGLMVGCTDSLYVVTNYLFDLLDASKDSFTPSVQDVYYGDQKRIPRTPAIAVFSSQKTRELDGVPRRIKNNFDIFICIFFSNVRDVTLNHRAADQLAEQVEVKIHEDITLGGNVINSLVVLNEGGFLNREESQFRGSRLIVQAMTKTTLPLIPSYNQP
jgi:hypothetical protein